MRGFQSLTGTSGSSVSNVENVEAGAVSFAKIINDDAFTLKNAAPWFFASKLVFTGYVFSCANSACSSASSNAIRLPHNLARITLAVIEPFTLNAAVYVDQRLDGDQQRHQ